MKRTHYLQLGSAALLLLSALGCSKEHVFNLAENDRDPENGGTTPPVPREIRVRVGNRQASLSWQLPDSSLADQIRSYKIYRRASTDETAELADSSQSSPSTITALANGEEVLLSVAAVLKNGLEGLRSTEVGATPGLFSIIIEGGRTVTNSREVSVALEAAEGTRAVRLGSTPDLAGSARQSFLPTLRWILAEGDGEQSVYAEFLDAVGNESQVVSDQIRLDTAADIRAFDFDGGESRVPGEVIIFTLDAGEPAGEAEVEITRGGPRRALRDDGVSPDASAGDGVYTLRYEAEASQQFLGAEMIGRFVDEAGNEAAERPALRRLTVHAPPPLLTLDPPTSSDPEAISLSWSQAPDGAAFASYRVFRSEREGVAVDPARQMVREVSSKTETSYTDTGLVPGRTYFYIVEMVDPQGFATPSNEVSGSPKANEAPAAVTLNDPYAITNESVSLSWNRSYEKDFSFYRLVRGEREGVTQDSTRRDITSIRDATQTSYEDRTEIEEGHTYFYIVEVVDVLGVSTASNEVTATTEDRFPSAVSLSAADEAGETAAGLSWTKNEDLDFESYRLYRSDVPGVDEGDTLLASFDSAERTRWLDTGLRENTDYYYRIMVRDKGGHATPSNEITVKTANADRPPVNLNPPVEVVGAQTPTLDLSWSATTIHDFENYRLYRDTSPAVGENSTLIRTIDTKTITTFRDQGLKDNTRYYYRIYVRDDAQGSAGSEERSVVTSNRPPKPVTLSVSATTTTSISLTWTASADADFSEYQLFRGTSPSAITTSVATFNRVEQTTYTDFLPSGDPDQDLFYKIAVHDKSISDGSSLSSDSNIVSGRVSEP